MRRPLFSEGDAQVALEATITEGAASESRQFSLTVAAIDIEGLIDPLTASGELSGPLASQLANQAKQAQHHYAAGRDKQAVKHLENLLKSLNNPAPQQHVSPAAKQVLSAETQALIHALPD